MIMTIMLAVVSVGGRTRWFHGFMGRTGHFLHEMESRGAGLGYKNNYRTD